MKLRFLLDVIPHKKQRYDTYGDYFYKDGCWKIVVSNQGTKDEQFVCFIHELVELYLTQKKKISEESATIFDKQHPNHPDPGFHPSAPYHKEHIFAHIIENLILEELKRSKNETIHKGGSYGEQIF